MVDLNYRCTNNLSSFLGRIPEGLRQTPTTPAPAPGALTGWGANPGEREGSRPCKGDRVRLHPLRGARGTVRGEI